MHTVHSPFEVACFPAYTDTSRTISAYCMKHFLTEHLLGIKISANHAKIVRDEAEGLDLHM